MDLSPPVENVEIVHMISMGACEYCTPENARHFIHNSLFAGASTRNAIQDGRARYTPCFFSEIPRLFREEVLPVDVAMCALSPPDEHGYCSFGVSVDYTKQAVDSAKTVIAQINDQMPRTLGDSYVHTTELDFIVEWSEPLPQIPAGSISAVEMEIGRHCAQLIDDGACLQVGIGGIPDAVLAALGSKKDLGIHTEMFSDGVVNLVEKGVITCSRKNLHRGRLIATFVMGTRKVYDFVHNNPMVEMHPVDYTNDPFIVAQNDNLVAINSALQVDLAGQVASDTIGARQYSGVGGQVDFLRGASRSSGGKAILALPSTAGDGSYSRIVPRLLDGASVTATRSDVHLIVTEYGIANLRGKSLRERALALISIAHPNFRDGLSMEMERRMLA